jgi:hypothetical protein
MLWTQEQQTASKNEGWELREVVNAGTTHVYLQIFSLIDAKHEAMTARVVSTARSGSRLHLEALRQIVASRAVAKQPRKSK